MTAETQAATATVDTNAGAAQTPASNAPATGAATPEGSPAVPQEGTQQGEGTPPEKAAEAATPEAYSFVMPEGVELDTQLAESVTPILAEAKVPPAVAQKLADALAAHIKSQQDQAPAVYAEMRRQEIAQQTEQWRAQITADPELGGPQAEAINKRVLAAVGALATEQFKAEMNAHGWGNHPELIRFINRCIDYVPAETGERAAGAGGSKPSAADVLYGG